MMDTCAYTGKEQLYRIEVKVNQFFLHDIGHQVKE